MKKFVSIVMAIMMITTLTACGAKTPDVVVGKFCDAVIDFNIDNIEKYVANSADIEIPEGIANAVRKHSKTITYTIGDYVTDDTNAEVEVEVTYPDLSVAIAKATTQYAMEAIEMSIKGATEEEMHTKFESIMEYNISNASPSMRTANVTFMCAMTENGWKVDVDFNNIIDNLIDNIM